MTDTLRIPGPMWFVGCGNMGSAILDGWRLGGLDLSTITVIRPSGRPVDGTRTVTSVADAGPPPRLAVLAFKPQTLDEIAPELRRRLSGNSVLISLLAGVEAASLRERFPGVRAIVRATPNLGTAVRRGVIGLFTEDASANDRSQVGDLFAALGYAMWMADEEKLGALGAVAGAGPAYVARFVAALAKAGVTRGLSEEVAATIALETVLGTTWLAAANGETMDALARRVASPNGTTEAGLAVLDRERVLDQLIAVAIDAAAARGAELAAAARGPLLAEGERVH